MKRILLSLLIPVLFSCSGGTGPDGTTGGGTGPTPPTPPAPEPLILNEPPAGPQNFIFLIDPAAPPELVDAIRRAEKRIESVMAAPLSRFNAKYADCGPADLNVSQIYDQDPRADTSILISVAYRVSGDAPRTALAVAAPCNIWEETYRTGEIYINPELSTYDRGVQTDTILHEILHVLGVGTSRAWWLNMTQDKAAGKAWSTTPYAKASYEQTGGGLTGVPLSRDWSHWSDTVFEGEIMNPYAGQPGQRQALSAVTLSALRDYGYPVDMSKADPYVLKLKGQSLPQLRIPIHGTEEGHTH